MDISGDQRLVAAGSTESHIRVWSMDGKPLKSTPETPQQSGDTSSSRRLIGHSGSVYAVSFSPAIAGDDPSDRLTRSRFLLSASADKTVRLWMLDCWQCLVVYKGHDHPVWDIKWGPYGHYFLTGSHDHTARLWTTDHVAPVRMFVGHDNDVDCVAFHPNNSYVFTASCDRTVRMWAIQSGNSVRMFTSHTGNITAIACAPNGKLLASADDTGTILIWDIASGRRLKRMRGHSKGGIWSLCFSMESSLLVSGGADATVRVWDALLQTEGPAAGTTKGVTDGSSAKTDGAAAGSSSAASGAKKGKAKDATITPDQISAFPTKKSPVYKVQFTNMNLILAGGAFMP